MNPEENQAINRRGRNEDNKENLFMANIQSVSFSTFLSAFFLAVIHTLELMLLMDLSWWDFLKLCPKIFLLNCAKLILEQYYSILAVPDFINTLIKHTSAVDKLKELYRTIK